MEYTVFNQMPYSLAWRLAEYQLSPAMEEKNIYLWAYSPLGQGLHTDAGGILLMRLTYNITEDAYLEVIEYQMRLHNRQPAQVIKYWALNLAFLGLAVYFLVARSGYAWPLRLMPLGMAAILLGISTYRRTNLPKRAEGRMKQLIDSGTLDKDYIGSHTLIVESGVVKRNYGSKWEEITCDELGGYDNLKSSGILIANGVLFELIPHETLDKDHNRENLEAAIRDGQSQNTEPVLKNITMEITWKVDEDIYIRGMVEGHRMYYSTRQAWKGSQTVRIVIFLYGLVVLCMRLNNYIGLAFVLIGILLNRQLLVTFSPFSYWVVSRQIKKARGYKEMGFESFYLTEQELIATCMHQIQRTDKKNITKCRYNREFFFIYTKQGQMYVIPDRAFGSVREKEQFLLKLNQ